MAEINKKNNEERDSEFKERFQFRLEVNGNLICRRYFRINNFNPTCLRSYELSSAIRKCGQIIDNDLKWKTQIYLEICAPRIFNTHSEMDKYFENPEHALDMRFGEGIVVCDESVNYFWGTNGPERCKTNFDDGEFCRPLTDDDRSICKFSFLVDGYEICATTWEGVYPKYIRNAIDLSNKRGKFEGEDLTRLSFEQYLLNKLVEGRGDLVFGLIKGICSACCIKDSSLYTISDEYYVDRKKNEPEDGKEYVTYKNKVGFYFNA